MSGWFAVKRGITRHPLFLGKPDRLMIWLWMIDNAAWKETSHDVNGKTVTVPRGCVCASERHIAMACGVGYQVVRTFLNRLKSEHMINATVTHGKNLITICNYEKYQNPQNVNNAPPNARLTHEQRTKEQGNKVTTEEEGKPSLSAEADAKAEIATAVSLFKEYAARQGWPAIRILSKARSAALRARLREAGLDGWQEALERAAASDHCNGQNDRGWVCNFDFLTQSKSFAKLVEGNFDNRKPKLKTIDGGHHGQRTGKDRLNAFVSGARGSS